MNDELSAALNTLRVLEDENRHLRRQLEASQATVGTALDWGGMIDALAAENARLRAALAYAEHKCDQALQGRSGALEAALWTIRDALHQTPDSALMRLVRASVRLRATNQACTASIGEPEHDAAIGEDEVAYAEWLAAVAAVADS